MDSALSSTGQLAMSQGLPPSALNAAGRKGSGRDLDKVAKDFEGMFLSQMLQPMFDTVKVNKMFGGGHGEEMMRGFLVQEYGKAMAERSSLGIGDAIKKQLLRLQESAQSNSQKVNNGATHVLGQNF